MKRYIKSSDQIYEVKTEKSGKSKLGYYQSYRPVIQTGTLEDQIRYLKDHYEYFKKEYRKAFGKDLDFSKLTTIEKVLSAYRQIDKACKLSNPEFFNVKKKYSYRKM